MRRTRHFLLDRRAGWHEEPFLASGVEWDDGAIRLRPLPGAPQPFTDASGAFGGLADPIGVAVGPDGTVVILDRAGTRILRYDPCAATFGPLPCLFDTFTLARARDVAITCCGDVVVTDTGNRRVLILFGTGVAVRHVVKGPDPDWEPWGVAAWRSGIVVTDHSKGFVHWFDDGGHLQHSSAAALSKPTAVAVDKSGNAYVLQEGSNKVRILDREGALVADVDTLDDRRHAFCPITVAVGPNGDLCLGGVGGGLCVVEGTPSGWHVIGGVPIDAPVRGLAFDADGNPVTIDGSRCCVVGLRNGGGYPKRGQFVTTALDSGLSACRWHRVALTASIPTGTTIGVETLTAEAPLEPAELLALPDARWATGQIAAAVDNNRWDCLIGSAPGRYLWLRLTLESDGAATPQIDDVEVWFPRLTSLDYLPKAFRNDPDSADFLERFLSIADNQRGTVTTEVDRMAALFDPMAVPTEFLSWLSEWVGMALDEQLPLERRRRLVREAAALYRLRGTPEGVRRFVSLFCGVEVKVLEHYRLRRWAIAGRGRLGDATQLFGPEIVRRLQLDEFSEIGEFRLIDTDDPLRDPFHVYAHKFSLFLLACEEERLMARARRVADLAKPAHTEVDVTAIEPRLRVGSQSTVGLDTVIGAVPPPGRTGDARLGRGVVVGPDPQLGGRAVAQIGMRGRIGVDAGLD